MELLGFILIGFWAQHYVREQRAQDRIMREQAAAYRHPALQPATIYSPEFYAALSSRYNRPFLGK